MDEAVNAGDVFVLANRERVTVTRVYGWAQDRRCDYVSADGKYRARAYPTRLFFDDPAWPDGTPWSRAH
jgi:hypothetical protein